jgi:hypothetical protein
LTATANNRQQQPQRQASQFRFCCGTGMMGLPLPLPLPLPRLLLLQLLLLLALLLTATTSTTSRASSAHRMSVPKPVVVPGKTIWLLWLSGWHEDVPWISQQVAESWEFHNPTWNVELLTEENLHVFVDIPYLFKVASRQAKSDIIRLYLLDMHGGVWADATMLCMVSLDSWVYDALAPAGFWMYHGGAKSQYPASWFMVSVKHAPIVHEWRLMCDEYWATHEKPHNYFWMDSLFNRRIKSDESFMALWLAVPYLSCKDKGQAHLYRNNIFKAMDEETRSMLTNNAPYAIKLSSKYPRVLNETNLPDLVHSRGYVTVQLAKVARNNVLHPMVYRQPQLQQLSASSNSSSSSNTSSSSSKDEIYVRCVDLYNIARARSGTSSSGRSSSVQAQRDWKEAVLQRRGTVVVRDTCNLCKDFAVEPTAAAAAAAASTIRSSAAGGGGPVCVPAPPSILINDKRGRRPPASGAAAGAKRK